MKKKKIWLSILLLISLFLLCSFGALVGTYNSAQNLLSQGKYEEAAEKFGVNVKAALLVKAIDRTNLKFISIDDCKDDYTSYFETLNSFNTKLLGGSIPDEDIFYTK